MTRSSFRVADAERDEMQARRDRAGDLRACFIRIVGNGRRAPTATPSLTAPCVSARLHLRLWHDAPRSAAARAASFSIAIPRCALSDHQAVIYSGPLVTRDTLPTIHYAPSKLPAMILLPRIIIMLQARITSRLMRTAVQYICH